MHNFTIKITNIVVSSTEIEKIFCNFVVEYTNLSAERYSYHKDVEDHNRKNKAKFESRARRDECSHPLEFGHIRPVDGSGGGAISTHKGQTDTPALGATKCTPFRRS